MATSRQKKVLEMKPAEPTIEELGAQITVYNDFVMVKPIEEVVGSGVIEQSEHWKQNPNQAIVVAVGEGRVVGGVFLPINCKPGEKVRITKYGEDVNVSGVKLQLVHAAEIRFGWKK